MMREVADILYCHCRAALPHTAAFLTFDSKSSFAATESESHSGRVGSMAGFKSTHASLLIYRLKSSMGAFKTTILHFKFLSLLPVAGTTVQRHF